MKVLDLMTTDVITVTSATSLREAARLMVGSGVSGLPVVDADGTLIGIITEADFLQKEVEREHPVRPGLLSALFGRSETVAEAETVGEVMTSDVVTVGHDASLAEAARLMTTHGVKRLPVVDANGRVLGIISRANIVQAFTRPDEVIEDEIREDVIRRLLFLDPNETDVSVTDGVVRLKGELPTRSDVRLLHEMSRRLDGVIRVEDELTWAVDDTRLEGKPGTP